MSHTYVSHTHTYIYIYDVSSVPPVFIHRGQWSQWPLHAMRGDPDGAKPRGVDHRLGGSAAVLGENNEKTCEKKRVRLWRSD